jgi:hypothetical protein
VCHDLNKLNTDHQGPGALSDIHFGGTHQATAGRTAAAIVIDSETTKSGSYRQRALRISVGDRL